VAKRLQPAVGETPPPEHHGCRTHPKLLGRAPDACTLSRKQDDSASKHQAIWSGARTDQALEVSSILTVHEDGRGIASHVAASYGTAVDMLPGLDLDMSNAAATLVCQTQHPALPRRCPADGQLHDVTPADTVRSEKRTLEAPG